ncbi:MAG TPA: hypothetical protein IGS53_24625 [Leptolyngbyaceae cyanobacterium M33_DOE_097]|uniref:DUF721 domain-containing protein n=1 Tax=Oscillatoriales cyanobacterium SpSt-418 TaxID=2282169 RepID=A0A7C3KG26_9CYAN|nr:hypothetical protein [Leptolyngbyaceae cyanobacterium M33_DOE_097]
MSLDFTVDDLAVLEQYQIERLLSLFADTLPFCCLNHCKNQLTIHCSEPWIVDELLAQIDQLRCAVKVVMGVKKISIRFAQEEIYKTLTTPHPKKRLVKILH